MTDAKHGAISDEPHLAIDCYGPDAVRGDLMGTGRSLMSIPKRTVDIWILPTGSLPDSAVERFREYLSRDEQGRADRFATEQLRFSFIQTRGVLRVLLGHYLGVGPKAVSIKYGPKGKPFVALGTDNTDLRFNTAHSRDLSLVALAKGCELGIDIEAIRPLSDPLSIADRFFCPEEASQLALLSGSLREQAFYRCWTRKEAYVKATGDGLSTRLDTFRVTLQPGESVRFLHVNGDATEARAWTLHDLVLPNLYLGALAYRDRRRPIRLFALPGPAHVLDTA